MIRAVFKLVFGSILGKLSGVVRELLLAGLYGTGVVASAARAAQSSTLIPVDFFTANALASAFLPVYTRLKAESEGRASLLFWSVLLLMLLCSACIALALITYGAAWVSLVFPGFSDEAKRVTHSMLSVMAFGVPFYVVGNLLSYLAMGNGNFAMASTRATIQNAGMVTGVLIAWWLDNPSFIAWGFTGAYFLYCIWGGGVCYRKRYAPLSHFSRGKEMARVCAQFWAAMRPLLALPLLLQGNAVVERMVASLVDEGAVAALGYAKLVTDTGVLLVAMPLGLASLSAMSVMKEDEVLAVLRKILPPLFLLAIPTAFYFVSQSELFVTLVFEHGSFDKSSTAVTHEILRGLSWGLWAQIGAYFLVKVLSSRLRNREVFIYMGAAILVNLILNVSLFQLLGAEALGLSSSAYALVLFVLSAKALKINGLVWSSVLPLLLGGIIYLLVMNFASFSPTALGGVASLVTSALFWLAFFFVVPRLRRDMVFFVSSLGRVRNV